MPAIENLLKFMNLGSEEDDYDDEDFLDSEEEDDYEEELAPKRKFLSKEPAIEDSYDFEPKANKRSNITPMRSTRRSHGSGMEVCVIKPTSMEDAREITETLLKELTIVLNMEGIDMDMAQRIIDFASGSCFAVKGNLQKISNYIFIITPETVDISGDFQNIMEASGINADL